MSQQCYARMTTIGRSKCCFLREYDDYTDQGYEVVRFEMHVPRIRKILLPSSWSCRKKLRPEMKISSDLLNIGVTQTTPCHVTEGGTTRVLPYKCKSRACSIYHRSVIRYLPSRATCSQRLHSTQRDFMSAYCNAQAPRVSCVLWQQNTNIGNMNPSVPADLICDAIWKAF